jgi:hypothetical protein
MRHNGHSASSQTPPSIQRNRIHPIDQQITIPYHHPAQSQTKTLKLYKRKGVSAKKKGVNAKKKSVNVNN